MERQIIHIDLPRFVSSIETAIEPTLKTKAFAVVPTVSPRAPVVDVSLEAWRDGVRKGMKFHEAKKLIPRLRAVRPHWGAARSAGEKLFEIAHSLSPFVEPAGHGHLFADVTGQNQWVDRLRAEVRRLQVFNCVLGVATNKLVSKVADRAFKLWQPSGDGILRVEPGEEETFMAPLPVVLLPEVHPKTAGLFDLLNVRFMRDLAGLDPVEAHTVLGKKGPVLVREARGKDDAPVLPYTEGHDTLEECVIFSPDTNDWSLIRARLFVAVEKLESLLHERGLMAGHLSLDVHYADLRIVRRHQRLGGGSKSLTGNPHPGPLPFRARGFPLLEEERGRVRSSEPLDVGTGPENVHNLFTEANAALEAACTRRVRVKSIVVELSELRPLSRQIGLFRDTQAERKQRMADAVHAIRAKFGFDAIRFGASLPPIPTFPHKGGRASDIPLPLDGGGYGWG